jgi:hypothetical protein
MKGHEDKQKTILSEGAQLNIFANYLETEEITKI